ncbi:uncharacterized protein LOC104422301 isoform X2 [Eucalyptus grandis]|uniref:uncharacterized protein LOC104422301 isoform X2 n=1 Tax=Eucalyptus grandis TaxID=71139 RepID=UPI00192EE8D1|nr:uncharacterized protein LOC104422301 isoform X2 [Eucalyptus grandis]
MRCMHVCWKERVPERVFCLKDLTGYCFWVMESCDDEKDGVSENLMPKALSPRVASGGAKFVDEVLNGQDECCLDNFRMDKNVFYKLCHVLQSRGLLRHTNRIKIEEQLAIFLFITGHNLRTRAVQELFRSDVPQEVLENPRLYPYFNLVHLTSSFITSWLGGKAQHLNCESYILLSQGITNCRSRKTQVKLVVAGCAIHNYIHREKPEDWLFRRFEHGDVMQMDEALPSVEVEQPMFFENQDLDFPFVTQDLEMSLQLRDSLATEMWNDCQ